MSAVHVTYPDDKSDYNSWSQYFKEVIWERINKSIKSHKASDAIVLFATSLFPFLENFQETYRIGRQAKIAEALSKLLCLRNTIHNGFNGVKTVMNKEDKDQDALIKQHVREALNAYYGENGMKQILEENRDENTLFDNDFVANIENIFSTSIFDSNVMGNTEEDVEKLAEYWKDAWKIDYPKEGDEGGGTSKNKVASDSNVNNGLNEVASFISGQNSSVQARTRWEETELEKILSEIHMFIKNFVDQIKQFVNGQKT